MSHGEQSEFDAIVSQSDTAEFSFETMRGIALSEMEEDYRRYLGGTKQLIVDRCREIVASGKESEGVTAAAREFLDRLEKGELK